MPLYSKPKQKGKSPKSASASPSKIETDADDFISVISIVDTEASTIQRERDDTIMATQSPAPIAFKAPKPTPFTGEKRDSEAVENFLYQAGKFQSWQLTDAFRF